MHTIKNIKKILFDLVKHPSKAFREINKTQGIIEPFFLVLIAGIIGCILSLIFKLIVNASLLPEILTEINWFNTFAPVLPAVVGIIIIAIILHIIIKIFKGEANLATTYKIIAFASLPTLLFSQLPYLTDWIIYLSIFYVIFGIVKLHNISPIRAFFSVLIIHFLYWLIQIIVGFVLMNFYVGGAV